MPNAAFMVALPDPHEVDRPWLAAYPPGVPVTYAYPDVPLTRLLDDAARDFPDVTATWFRGATLTWAELVDLVDRFATALRQLGVGPGSRVGVVLPNLPANVVATFATLRLGGVVVQHDPGLADGPLADQVRKARDEVVVATAASAPGLAALADRDVAIGRGGVAGERGVAAPDVDVAPLRHVIVTSARDWLPRRRVVAALRRLPLPLRRSAGQRGGTASGAAGGAVGVVLEWDEVLADAAPIVRPAPVRAGDRAVIHFTARPGQPTRGIVASHGSVLANAFQARLWLPDAQAGKERVLCVVEFWRAHGFTLGMMTAVLSASTMVLTATAEPADVLSAIDRAKPTLFPGIPAIYRSLVEHPSVHRHDLTSIRAGVSGAEPLPAGLAAEFERLSGGARLREGYGRSEAGPLTHANPIYGRAIPGTIGLPVTDTIAIVVDGDGHQVPHDQPGELLVHGPQVMVGYLDDVDGTAAVIVGGWLRTGDIVTCSADGVFTLVGRRTDDNHQERD